VAERRKSSSTLNEIPYRYFSESHAFSEIADVAQDSPWIWCFIESVGTSLAIGTPRSVI
jgi:hypothetical protein